MFDFRGCETVNPLAIIAMDCWNITSASMMFPATKTSVYFGDFPMFDDTGGEVKPLKP